MRIEAYMKKVWDIDLGWISGIGGGAFAGKASEDSKVEEGEDLSDEVFTLSVRETPLLDMLGDSGIEATQQIHEWREDTLNPHIGTLGENVASDASAAFALPVATATHFLPGMILEDGKDGKVIHEQMLVQSVFGANTLVVDRAIAGTSATSHADNAVLDIVASAAFEGADPSDDTSTTRARLDNFTQIIERNVTVTGTKNATRNTGHSGVNETDHQVTQRLAEMLREYEYSLIRGRRLTTTINGQARRTMAGFVPSITQITSLGPITSSGLDNLLETVWTQGGNPDLILVNAGNKRVINTFPGAAVRQNQAERVFIRQVNVYEGFKDQQAVMQNRYADPQKVAVGQANMVRTVPMVGRSFFADTLGKTGDKRQVQVIGEVTNEFGNDKSWAVGAPATPS